MAKSKVPADLQRCHRTLVKMSKKRSIALFKLPPSHFWRKGEFAFPDQNTFFPQRKAIYAGKPFPVFVLKLNPLVKKDLGRAELLLGRFPEGFLVPDALGPRPFQSRFRYARRA